MRKMWRVAWYEYRRHVFQKRFLLSIFGLPMVFGLIAFITFLLIGLQIDNRPTGYVDQNGILAQVEFDSVSPIFGGGLIPLADEASAQTALQSEEIQGYYVLPPDFSETFEARLYFDEDKPNRTSEGQLKAWIRAERFSDQPPQIVNRIIRGFQVVSRQPDGSLQPTWVSLISQLILPMAVGAIFIVAIFTSSGYLMQAVVEEKENQMMEILITSLSATKLMSGKIVGTTLVGLTQMTIWAFFLGLGFFALSKVTTIAQNIQLEGAILLWLLLIMLAAYVMVAALMTAVGATVTQASEGQQLTGMFTLPILMPYWFITLIIANPNSPLAIALSFFPLTAPVTLSIRLGVTEIPTWQLALNVLLVLATAGGAIWLAGRTFRLGMLRYGQKLRWREVFSTNNSG